MVDLSPALIYIDELVAAGEDARAFRRAARAGHFIRIRRGVYVARAEWDAASERERHIARTRAVFSQLRTGSPALAAGYSAAALHGVPVRRRWPEHVTLLMPYRGGGTAEPGVVRTSARWDERHSALVRGVPSTCLERTLFDVVLLDGFANGVATLDAALRSGATAKDALRDFLEEWSPASGAARCAAALGFADAASESFGESLARAIMHALGFVAPVLQHEFRDGDGSMLVDFCWPQLGIAAEFDGKMKYTRDEFSRGDPAEVVWREKRREDRLRRHVRTVVRIVW
ncbi:hypothetical protein FJ656_20800, partial [Schumannella luteola]